MRCVPKLSWQVVSKEFRDSKQAVERRDVELYVVREIAARVTGASRVSSIRPEVIPS